MVTVQLCQGDASNLASSDIGIRWPVPGLANKTTRGCMVSCAMVLDQFVGCSQASVDNEEGIINWNL